MTYIMDTKEEGDRIERKTDRELTIEQLGWGMRTIYLLGRVSSMSRGPGSCSSTFNDQGWYWRR